MLACSSVFFCSTGRTIVKVLQQIMHAESVSDLSQFLHSSYVRNILVIYLICVIYQIHNLYNI